MMGACWEQCLVVRHFTSCAWYCNLLRQRDRGFVLAHIICIGGYLVNHHSDFCTADVKGWQLDLVSVH